MEYRYPNMGMCRLIKNSGRYFFCPLSQNDPYLSRYVGVKDENGIDVDVPEFSITPTLRIECEWDDSIVSILRNYSVKGLDLNASYGWRCTDYSFLSRIPQMKRIRILSSSTSELKSIENQTELEELVLHCSMNGNESINFNSFTKLKRLACNGNVVNDSLFYCTDLAYLFINELSVKSVIHMERLTNLKELTIKNSSITNIDFAFSLSSLKKLSLDNCRSIRVFDPISSVHQLRWLSLRGVVIRDLSFLEKMPQLRIIVIETGKVNSIKPICEINNLQALSISGSVLDKDLEPIHKLPLLSMLWIKNRQDYEYKINNHWDWEDLGEPRQEWLSIKHNSTK